MTHFSGSDGWGSRGSRRQRGVRPDNGTERTLSDAARGRRPRMWAAAFAVVAMVSLGGVAPALAEDPVGGAADPASSSAPAADQGTPGDPGATVGDSETPPTDPVTPPPAAPPVAPPAETPPAAPEPAAEPVAPPVSGGEEEQNAQAVEEQPAPTALESAPEPPYLRWVAVDESDTPVGETTFTVQGPRDTNAVASEKDPDAPWVASLSATIADNVGQEGYAGADLDPEPGAFLVKSLTHDTDATRTHEVGADEHYRVRAAQAPEGLLVLDAAEWTELAVAVTAETPVDRVTLFEEQQMSILSIPNTGPLPPTGQTTLRVTKLGTRLADGSVSRLAGVTFYATAGTVRGAQPGMNTPGTYSCTTNAQGTCDMVVPQQDGSQNGSGGGNRGYWVFESATMPSGWGRITQIGTGNFDSGKTASNYMFFTGNVTNNSTIYEVTKDTTAYSRNSASTGWTNPTATTRTDENGFANVRSNPAFPAACGLSIAMVFDVSSSIDQTEMNQMKSAANGFVGTSGLGGTDSKVALYKFGTTASKMLNVTSILTSGGRTTVTNSINTLTPSPTNPNPQYTNWDDAMRKVAFNGTEKYDLVLFMTDGDPTVHGTNPVTSGQNSEVETNIGFRNVEEGAFSANAVKGMTGPSGQATKVVAIGIGLQSNSYLNLRAISGPTVNEDYFTTGFSQLAAELQALAKRNCGGSLTITKKTVDAQNNLISEVTGGWAFQATTPDGAFILNPPGANVQTVTRATPVGPPAGGVNFAIDLTAQASRTVSITETVQANWTPVSVTCTGANPTWSGEAFTGSFSVSIAREVIASCVVTNKQAPQTADATWKKIDNSTPAVALGGSKWTIVGGTAFPAPGAEIVDCVAVGCTGLLDKDPAIGAFKLVGLAIGTYTVTETTAPPGYTGGASFTITVNGGNAGTTIDKGNHVNTKMLGTATWKKVSSEAGQALLGGSEWKLVGPGHPGPTGTTITDCTAAGCAGLLDKDPVAGQFKIEGLAWGAYTLTESKAPFGYLLDQTVHNFTVDVNNVGAAITVGTFVNVPITPPTVPLTGGIGRDQVLIVGALVLGMAVIAGLATIRRRRTGA